MSARKSPGLTTEDLETLLAGLAARKRVTVYLREPMPSLDLAAGTSARVISIDGTTVTVSPKGIDDQLPFEADELQRTRPSAASGSASRRRSLPDAGTPMQAGSRSTSRTGSATDEPDVRSEPKPKSANGVGAAPAPTPTPKASTGTRLESKPAPTRTPRRKKATPTAVSVTITSTGPTSWSVSVAHGAKKQGRPVEVSADRVVRAMRELGDDTAIGAVDEVIESARLAAQRRIDELNLELETARAALADLDGTPGRPT